MKTTVKGLKSRLSSRRGMTLVEVLVAMAVLMIVIFTFTPLFAQYFRNVQASGQMTRQTYEKASLIERLLSNKNSDNDEHYETPDVNVPLELYVKNASNETLKTLDFHSGEGSANYVVDVSGNFVTTDGDKTGTGNDYSTIYLPSNNERLIAFPSSLTDDFIEKDILVVFQGFGRLTQSKIKVYYTDSTGNWRNNPVSSNYYTITDVTSTANTDDPCLKFTFKGANDVICFDNSPLVISYNSHAVKIEINAPKIIMVGEKAVDKNGNEDYYYYCTAGVDTATGRMDLVAKDSADLTSAMNDVEWVEKGMGDDGNGNANTYGYYVMGGDAGQVRRFWKRTTGNYYWGGDYLWNYDSYANYKGKSGTQGTPYENFERTLTTQASFKKIVTTTNPNMNTTNGMNTTTLLDSNKAGFGDWNGITTNYFTANVTSADASKYSVTLGRALNVGWKNGGTTGRSGMDIGATSAENQNLVTRLSYSTTGPGSTLDINGYKAATNYEYPDDDSLVTITSVGPVNFSGSMYTVQNKSSIKNNVYPTQSYTLYCGTVPAVIDIFGDADAATLNVSLFGNDGGWVHDATLGVVTDGESWYPVGKFGDSYAVSTALSSDVFPSLTWRNLLNYRDPVNDIREFNETYPAVSDGTQSTIHHNAYDEVKGKYTHILTLTVRYKYKKNLFSYPETTANIDLTVTEAGKVYPYDWTGGSGDDFNNQINTAIKGISNFNSQVDENRRVVAVVSSKYYDENGALVDDIGEYSADHTVGSSSTDGHNLFWESSQTVWKSKETKYRTTTHYDAYDEVVGTDDAIWYYGPNSSSVTNTMTNHTHKVEAVGTALPTDNNSYYITDGREVDVTLGYLSHPYAIGVETPEVPQIDGFIGSDRFFANAGHGDNSRYDHSFFSGGLRDNVTMLDIKSYRDDIKETTFSLAGGYTLSYLYGDHETGSGLSKKHSTYLSQVYNTGIVYIRATGDGNNNDTKGSMASGKGWSLGYGTNVFHQFYGSDQFTGEFEDTNWLGQCIQRNGGALGWNTAYHLAYYNISRDEYSAPNGSNTRSRFEGSPNYGINCHPLGATEVTAVNWGQTWDEKPEAMWGTANGTVISWFYDYENPASSKITSVRKEFESYMWADRYGSIVTNMDSGGHYDLSTITISSNTIGTNGFISVLDSINSIYFSDGYWVAVGNCSNKDPADYCVSNQGNYSEAGTSGGDVRGSYINVKGNDGDGKIKWKAVKVSDDQRINFVSVECCEGIWYAMGYIDNGAGNHAGNGKQDSDEEGVIYYATNPLETSKNSRISGGAYTNSDNYNGGWRRAITRDVTATSDKEYTVDTSVLKLDSTGSFESFELQGVNSMASQG